ncbi:MAG: SUMF1/EgtB/PvdO family nonheme iron enzyme, partial [Treponema sp.]|nr:SUMF1/EgtB/PvdO family nonheme iron enzyme [Treponema sp.]
MSKRIHGIAALVVLAAAAGCVSSGSFSGGSLTDTEISAMAALGRGDDALSGPLFEGDGGKDIRLAVLEPELRGAGAADGWLPVYVQGLLHSGFRKYSGMTLIDRQNLSQVLAEQDLAAGGRFSDRDFISLGNLTNAEYFLTGTIQKLPSGEFAVSLSVTGAGSGESRASFMQNGTAGALQDGILINGALESLLAQMGVRLTETGRRTLTTGRYMAARAEAGFARGLAAQESGAAVEALLNYSQAAAFDPSRMEALARLGSVSSEISGGSVSANILNDIQARNAWIPAFREAAAFFNSRPPFEITYDPNLVQLGNTDYAKNQADLGMWIRADPSEAGFAALNALIEGLEKTGRRETWGFSGWPLQDINPRTPGTTVFPGARSFSFAVQTALLNERGKVIARGNITLKTGEFAFKPGDTQVRAPESALGQIAYPKVNAADLTPTLTVVIAGVNGMSGREISETGYMRIAPGDIGPATMMRVEGGTFQMGSNNGSSDEKPVHRVTVKSFYMGKYEVTQGEWIRVMGSNPSNWKGDTLPVEKVSWYDAVEYCNKLSRQEGLTPAYWGSRDSITCDFNATGYRLPTEAEWEYAAKGGNKGSMTYEYAGGNAVDSVAWYDGNSGNRTHPVGTKQPNSLGLYDM